MSKLFAVVLVALAGWACIAQAQEREVSPARALPGRWQIIEDATGAEVAGCGADAQEFSGEDSGSFLLRQNIDGKLMTARYLRLQEFRNQILLFIEGESRLNDNGDPVIWIAVFKDKDHFRWRRYDWPAGATVAGEWRRCPS